jgi:hypothetical protein
MLEKTQRLALNISRKRVSMTPELYVASGREIRPAPMTAAVNENMLPFIEPGLNFVNKKLRGFLIN